MPRPSLKRARLMGLPGASAMHYAWLRYVLRKSYARAVQGLCKGCAVLCMLLSLKAVQLDPFHLNFIELAASQVPPPSAAKDCKALPSTAMSLQGLCDLQTLHRPLGIGDGLPGLPFRGDLGTRNGQKWYGNVWDVSVLFSPSHGDATNPCSLMNIPRLNSIVCLGILIYWTRFLVAFSSSLPSTWRVRTQISWGYSNEALTNIDKCPAWMLRTCALSWWSMEIHLHNPRVQDGAKQSCKMLQVSTSFSTSCHLGVSQTWYRWAKKWRIRRAMSCCSTWWTLVASLLN